MLNKELCKRCWREYWNEESMWNIYRVDTGEKGYVMCCLSYVGKIKICRKPPKRCKFYLEHIV